MFRPYRVRMALLRWGLVIDDEALAGIHAAIERIHAKTGITSLPRLLARII